MESNLKSISKAISDLSGNQKQMLAHVVNIGLSGTKLPAVKEQKEIQELILELVKITQVERETVDRAVLKYVSKVSIIPFLKDAKQVILSVGKTTEVYSELVYNFINDIGYEL